MIVYISTNTITNESYVGKTTKSLDERLKVHLKNVRKGCVSHFYNAIRKYGPEKFQWSILCECDNIEILNEQEKYFIKQYNTINTGYNMTSGGDGGDTISTKTPLEKKKQGAKKGNVPWNKGISMKQMGYKVPPRKSRQKFTEEQKTSHSISIKQSDRYKLGLSKRSISKQIKICDEFGNEWNTQKEWRSDLGLKYRSAKRILNGEPHLGVRYFVKFSKGV